MSCDVYKKVAISILASLKNKENAVVAVSSSNKCVDTNKVARGLAGAFGSMELSVALLNAKVDGVEEISKTDTKKTNEKFFEISFENKSGTKMTSLSAKLDVNEIKSTANITLIALDEIANSAPAMMLGSCCDGILLAERKNSSRTDNIDKAVNVIQNICVKPLGFILV
ncbi:MAG: hypothetical protein WAX04_08395 [Oscillospiraceae bacterium]